DGFPVQLEVGANPRPRVFQVRSRRQPRYGSAAAFGADAVIAVGSLPEEYGRVPDRILDQLIGQLPTLVGSSLGFIPFVERAAQPGGKIEIPAEVVFQVQPEVIALVGVFGNNPLLVKITA